MNLTIADYSYSGFFKVCLRDGEAFAEREGFSYALDLPMLWIINIPANIIVVGKRAFTYTFYNRFVNFPLLHLVEQCNLISIV